MIRAAKTAKALEAPKTARATKATKAAKTARAPKPTASPRTDAAVAELLRRLDPPMRPLIDAIRTLVLDASPAVREIVKWNAPSFRAGEHDFLTLALRTKGHVRLVFHTGAKVRPGAAKPDIPDPAALLEWLAPDRALVTLAATDLEPKRSALTALVRAWVRALPAS